MTTASAPTPSIPASVGAETTNIVTGSGTEPAVEVSYGEQISRHARNDPQGVAVVCVAQNDTEEAVTWSELEAMANQAGRVLTEDGVGKGSLVAIAIPNSLTLVAAALGCWKVGAVPVPLRWDLPDWERDRLLAVITPTALIDEGSRAEFLRRLRSQPDNALPRAISPCVQGICSSGSTGLPKVIMSTMPTICTPQLGKPLIDYWNGRRTSRQRVLVPAPMYHANGFGTLYNLIVGDVLVILEKFSAAAVLNAIEAHRITTFTATPTMLLRVADLAESRSYDLSSVEWILQGAASMPEQTLRRWFRLLSPEQIVMIYGMTEGLGTAALRGDEWLAHPGSVGTGFRGTEIKILDPNGKTMPVGEIGEIYLRAPTTGMFQYIGGAPLTPPTDDGFRTGGDLGYVDADGYLYIADRRTDMIVSGGANVYPSEVESALITHPDIMDVVVLGLTDPEWGRRVHAVVQLRAPNALTEREVISFAKSQLASYKVPKTVEFVTEIPRSAATKVNRSAMIKERDGD